MDRYHYTSMVKLTLFQQVLVWAIPILFGVTLHEIAHGLVALQLGDNTAKNLGRLSLNPLRHIDLVGTIIVPTILLLTTPFVFGWAKPVPVNWNHLKHPQRDMALVALAGPFANFLMAIFWAFVIKLNYPGTEALNGIEATLLAMGAIGIQINILLMILNLLPIPPLDGSRVVMAFFARKWTIKMAQYEMYGFVVLVFLLATGILGKTLRPLMVFTLQAILNLVGVSSGSHGGFR